VPFVLVLEYLPKPLKRALDRTARLQTVRETQIYTVQRVKEEVSKGPD
jgi:hypothetical protein